MDPSAEHPRDPASKASFFELVSGQRFNRDWTSYYGSWFLRLHTSTDQGTMIGLRSARFPDDSRATIQQLNVYERQETPTSKPRECDQFFVTPFTYDASITAASKAPYNVHTHDRQLPQLFLAFGDVDQESYATLPMYVSGEVVQTPIVANMTQDVYRYRFIPSEFFIADGPHRWALCMVYDAEIPGGPLTMVNLIREVATSVDPETPNVLYNHKDLLPPIRPNLGRDPEEWLPQSARQGTLKVITVDSATGDLVYLPPSTCTFHPPAPADSPTHRFMLLPDAGYCLLPKSIEGVRERGEDSFWAEYGVRTAKEGHFRVMRYVYDSSGTFQSLSSEAY